MCRRSAAGRSTCWSGTGPSPSWTSDFEELDRKKAYELAKLDRVFAYARTSRCRQLEILSYFGEQSAEPCGVCDNCRGAKSRSHARGVQLEAEQLADPVRKALSGVARCKGRFGKQVVAQMLCGSRSSKMTRFGLDKLSTFGLLSNLKQSEASVLLDELLRVGLVEQTDVDRFRPVVVLTSIGSEVMRGNEQVPSSLTLTPRAGGQARRTKGGPAGRDGAGASRPAAAGGAAGLAPRRGWAARAADLHDPAQRDLGADRAASSANA